MQTPSHAAFDLYCSALLENDGEADPVSGQDEATLNTQRTDKTAKRHLPTSGVDANDKKRDPGGSKPTTLQKVQPRQPRS